MINKRNTFFYKKVKALIKALHGEREL